MSYRTVDATLQARGYDPRATPIDTLMDDLTAIGLAVCAVMEDPEQFELFDTEDFDDGFQTEELDLAEEGDAMGDQFFRVAAIVHAPKEPLGTVPGYPVGYFTS